ncbi:MAG TPA: hypothetical protein VJ824_09945 [Bacillota bacterium]|nr:hypothetical protein [Bacillota bacterium]
MTKNKKQSMINPYTGRRMNVNSFSGKEFVWKDPNSLNRFNDLSSEEYYDYWEDDRLYQEPERNKYE